MEPRLLPLLFRLMLQETSPIATAVYHLLPLTPFATRSVLYLQYRTLLRMPLKTEEEIARESNRTVVLGLIGVSFTGLLALTVVDAKIDLKTFYPVYYMLISFLCFLTALNLQSYKRYRWHNLILNVGLIETAILSILLAISAIIWSSNQSTFDKALLSTLAFATWLADHLIRLTLLRNYLSIIKKRAGQPQPAKVPAAEPGPGKSAS